ncbi:MAG TPA: UbiA family prenyltransferase [Actinomycetes bacterium]|nr:UbiA family prenyltransferase [Actinomycetes bacterium]
MGSSSGRALAGLIQAAHPLPCLAVSGIAAGFAATSGRSTVDCLAIGGTVLASQLAIGWDNDYLDRDRDIAVDRRDKPLVTGAVSAGTVRAASAAAAVSFLVSLFWYPIRAAVVAVLAAAAAAGYNRGLKATALSPLPYAVSFGLLPAFVTLSADPAGWPPAWITAAAALLGVGAHFANALPDIGDDLATGVIGLPARLGPGRAALAAAGCLALAGVLLSAGIGLLAHPAGIALLAVNLLLSAAIAGWALISEHRSEAPFRLAVVVAVLDVLLLLGSGRVR